MINLSLFSIVSKDDVKMVKYLMLAVMMFLAVSVLVSLCLLIIASVNL